MYYMEKHATMDVFAAFVSVPYQFLTISRGGVVGDGITARTDAQGVFKLRNGMNVSNDQETKTSDATLHIKPTEAFVSTGLTGHGIEVQGRTYEIIGTTEGVNFDTGVTEHWRVTLQERAFEDLTV